MARAKSGLRGALRDRGPGSPSARAALQASASGMARSALAAGELQERARSRVQIIFLIICRIIYTS